MKTKAAVAGLPVSVFLSTNIRELGQLIQENCTTVYTQGMEQALVTTRAQARLQNQAETLEANKQELYTIKEPCTLVRMYCILKCSYCDVIGMFIYRL